jgi:hypothetical protein
MKKKNIFFQLFENLAIFSAKKLITFGLEKTRMPDKFSPPNKFIYTSDFRVRCRIKIVQYLEEEKIGLFFKDA